MHPFEEMIMKMAKRDAGSRPNTVNTVKDWLECTPLVTPKTSDARIFAFAEEVQALRLKHKIPHLGIVCGILTHDPDDKENADSFGECFFMDMWGQFQTIGAMFARAARAIQKREDR